MPDFVTLTCPSCGGSLKITSAVDRFACGHCGREHVVQRSGGIITIAPVVDAIRRVESGVDRTASELALSRIQRQLEDLEVRRRGLIDRYPKPHTSPIPFFFIIFGVLVGIVALSTMEYNGLGPVLLAVIVIGLGVAWIRSGFVVTRRWEAEFEKRLGLLEAELNQLEMEQSKHREIIGRA